MISPHSSSAAGAPLPQLTAPQLTAAFRPLFYLLYSLGTLHLLSHYLEDWALFPHLDLGFGQGSSRDLCLSRCLRVPGGKHPSAQLRDGCVTSWPGLPSPVRRDPPCGPGSALTLQLGQASWLTLGGWGLTSAGASGATEAACPAQLALSQRRHALTSCQRSILAVAFSEGNCTLHLPLVQTL